MIKMHISLNKALKLGVNGLINILIHVRAHPVPDTSLGPKYTVYVPDAFTRMYTRGRCVAFITPTLHCATTEQE